MLSTLKKHLLWNPFLAMVGPMSEGRVDLNVGFTFSLPFQVSMANEESAAPASHWPGPEALETESVFAEEGTSEIPFDDVGRFEDWELLLPSTSDRVCMEYGDHVFPMYKVVFKDMGFRLPFSDFQKEVFRWTKLSPSQIHPNSYAFMRAFKLVCNYLRIPVFKNVFFTIFAVQRGNDWVSFRQTKKMFEILRGKCGALRSVSS